MLKIIIVTLLGFETTAYWLLSKNTAALYNTNSVEKLWFKVVNHNPFPNERRARINKYN